MKLKKGSKVRLKTGEPVEVKFVFITRSGLMFHGIGIDDKLVYRNIRESDIKRLRKRKT